MKFKMFLATAVSAASVFSISVIAQKMSPEDVTAKSLAAIGAPEARAKIKNLAAMGEVTAEKLKTSTMPATTGKAALGSEGNKVLLAMGFPAATYPPEKLTFDGKDMKVALVRPGARSPLGDYFFRYDNIVKLGILGGALSTAWFLADSDLPGKLYFQGTKKVDGKDAYMLSFESKKSQDMKIHLYFDKDTFQHIRTEYQTTIAPMMGTTPTASSGLWEGHEELTEDFADFKTENGLTLPRSYKIKLHVETSTTQADYLYTFAFKDLLYNSNLDPNTFVQ